MQHRYICITIVLLLQVDTLVHIGEVRVILQFVPDTNKSGKLKVWIRQASRLKTHYDNGSFVVWLVIIVCSASYVVIVTELVYNKVDSFIISLVACM